MSYRKAARAKSLMPRLAAFLSTALATVAVPVVAPMAVGLSSDLALAQVAAVTPYYVVTTSDDALLRCGDLDRFYPVAKLKAGQVLRVDAESATWKRVAYPAGVGVYVKAEDVTANDAAKTATLTRASGLRAVNMNDGAKGSWKPVFTPQLPAGTVLNVMAFEDSPEPARRMYRVAAPEGARAFIHVSFVRRATDEEVKAFEAANPAAPSPVSPQANPPTNPQASPPANPQANPGIDLRDPPANPSTPGQGATPPINPEGATPTGANPAQPENVQPAEPPKPKVATPAELAAAFEQVRGQAELEAEWDELINEFERAIGALGDSDADARVRAGLNQRLELLKVRKELQLRRQELAQTKETLDKESKAWAERLASQGITTRYDMVGRLTTSAVYDGTRLPRMYRVQAVGEALPRTLGYIRPSEALQLETKVGRVVGIVGSTVFDSSLKLSVVTPKQVDVLAAQPPPVAPR